MPTSPDRWRLRNLISVWLGYWLTLGAVTLAPLAHVPGWSGAARLSTIALWVAGPPLAMWLVWLRGARQRGRAVPLVELLPPERPAAVFAPRDRGEPARAEDAGRVNRDAS